MARTALIPLFRIQNISTQVASFNIGPPNIKGLGFVEQVNGLFRLAVSSSITVEQNRVDRKQLESMQIKKFITITEQNTTFQVGDVTA